MGFIDATGKLVIPVLYDYAWDLGNNQTQVKLNGKTFYIVKTDKRID